MNILTFDIEEWFHILDLEETQGEPEWLCFEKRLDTNVARILNFLQERDQKATFFVLGWVARNYPTIVKRIHSCGMEIASHSDMHQLAYQQSRSSFRDDLDRSVKSLEDITGVKVTAYRAPGFSVKYSNLWIFEELARQGIDKDCSIFPAPRAHGGLTEFKVAQPAWVDYNGIRLKEFPINVYDSIAGKFVFSGGGYFRLLPYAWIRYLTKISPYMMTYFHPRDFDPGQPMIKELTPIRKFKSYVGLKTSLNKLRKLTEEFEFTNLEGADLFTDWDRAPIVKLDDTK